MNIQIENRQKKLPIDLPKLKRLTNSLASLAKVSLGEVTLIIVDDDGCAPINETAVGHSGPTDVITLFYPAIPGDVTGDTSEIILNAECALQQKPEAPLDELAFYLAHAFNHLSGHNDDTPSKRTAMHRRERRWLHIALNQK